MKITKIEVQKKDKNRVSLFIDNQFNCGLLADLVIKYRLKVNQEISQSELEHIVIDGEKEMARLKSIQYISKYQKSKKQLRDYLLKKGFGDDAINFALEKLEEYNFIDDESYAKAYVKDRTKRCGKRKLFFELKNKGIDENLVNVAIEEYSNDSENCVLLCEKYLKNKPKDYKTKQKTYRFLASRGFESDDIRSALNQFFKE